MAKHSRLSTSSKIVISVAAFLFLVDGVLGGVLMTHSVNHMKQILQSKVLEVSVTAASFLDGDKIKNLTKADYDPDNLENCSPEFQEIYGVLSKFKTSSVDNDGELAYIYCLVKTPEGKIVFSVDPSDVPGVFLEEETIYTDALYAAFEGKPGFDDQSYVDRWGDLFSGYAPVYGFDPDDREVKAVVGADVWASWYHQEITVNAAAIGTTIVVTIALGIAGSLFITSRIRRSFAALSNDMADLQSDVRQLIKDISDPRYFTSQVPYESASKKDRLALLKNQIEITRGEVKNYIAYMHEQAYRDPLTGLGNRNAYYDQVKLFETRIQEKSDQLFGVLVFDINGLKQINDNYGHEAGDRAIVVSGKSLAEMFGQNHAFRIGGDELVVVLDEIDEAGIKQKLSEYEKAFAESKERQELGFDLSLSYGYSVFDPETDNRYLDVFKRADEIMYKKKAKFYASLGQKPRKMKK